MPTTKERKKKKNFNLPNNREGQTNKAQLRLINDDLRNHCYELFKCKLINEKVQLIYYNSEEENNIYVHHIVRLKGNAS